MQSSFDAAIQPPQKRCKTVNRLCTKNPDGPRSAGRTCGATGFLLSTYMAGIGALLGDFEPFERDLIGHRDLQASTCLTSGSWGSSSTTAP